MNSVKIIMDDREDEEFSKYFSELNVELEVKRLLVGDFICSDDTVIERKTRRDFESSVIDRRLFNQIENLKSNYKNVIIIIEGEGKEESLSREALMGTYAFLVTNSIGLFFTRNISSTSEIIYSIAKHEQLSKKSSFSLNAKRKTNNLSQSQRAIIESFPMIGPKLAKSLLEEFGSLENVINAKEEELLKIDKLGPKKVKIFRKVVETEYNSDEDPI
ncbi:MAG: ERCC4 domain-containing protein [Candidatus ainarchaeum sp.]|nr:ERCC4 domain-containing protein [Candidatus ainarchaeum sp.]